MTSWALKGEYDDERTLHVEPSINGEVVVRIDGGEPMFFFGDDLLRMVEHVVDEANAALVDEPS